MPTVKQPGSSRISSLGRIRKPASDGRNRRPERYWLIYTSGDVGDERPLILAAHGKELLPVFSFREEAELYLTLTPRSAHLRVREADALEVSFLLGEARLEVDGVVLDPIPEVGGAALLDLLSIGSEEFVSSVLGRVRYREYGRPAIANQ